MTRPRREAPERVLLLRALEEGRGLDANAAAGLLGLAKRNARAHLQLLHADRLVRVASWRCNGRGPWYPIYALGDDADAPRPGRQDKLARVRARRRIGFAGLTL